MSRINKLLLRFLSFPVDFRFAELCKLLRHFDFRLSNAGATSGSRVIFVNRSGDTIKVHRPHGSTPLDPGALHDVYDNLERLGLI
jgi:hypothetical protein